MLSRLHKRLLILILGLELFLAGNVADVANDDKPAVQIIEDARLYADF